MPSENKPINIVIVVEDGMVVDVYADSPGASMRVADLDVQEDRQDRSELVLHMPTDDLDKLFEKYLAYDDDTVLGIQV